MSAAFDAYVRGFARELVTAAEQTPLLSLTDLATGHYLHPDAPHEVARLILSCLDG
ncbi:hypothetical protein [Nonomuraea sp. NPDC002799]